MLKNRAIRTKRLKSGGLGVEGEGRDREGGKEKCRAQ